MGTSSFFSCSFRMYRTLIINVYDLEFLFCKNWIECTYHVGCSSCVLLLLFQLDFKILKMTDLLTDLLNFGLFSRFGKFVEIQFDANGRISGAAIRTYLLDSGEITCSPDNRPWQELSLFLSAVRFWNVILFPVLLRLIRYWFQFSCYRATQDFFFIFFWNSKEKITIRLNDWFFFSKIFKQKCKRIINIIFYF